MDEEARDVSGDGRTGTAVGEAQARPRVLSRRATKRWRRATVHVRRAWRSLRRPPYFLSVVCIVKNENAYLEEFVSYYAVLGVEHFFIYDNGSEVPPSAALRNCADICTIIPFPGQGRQLRAYQHFIDEYSHLTTWAAIVDVDEFIVPKSHDTLTEFLWDRRNIDAIAINWVIFGDSGHVTPPEGLVIDNYVRRAPVQNATCKTIARARKLRRPGSDPHHFILKEGARYVDPKGNDVTGALNRNPTTDIIQINHYWTKSRQEFSAKLARGFADKRGRREIADYDALQKELNSVKDTTLADRFSASVHGFMSERRSSIRA
jgi:Glycosyl transferase family 2